MPIHNRAYYSNLSHIFVKNLYNHKILKLRHRTQDIFLRKHKNVGTLVSLKNELTWSEECDINLAIFKSQYENTRFIKIATEMFQNNTVHC